MSFICMLGVLHYNCGWLSADTLQAVGCKEICIVALVRVRVRVRCRTRCAHRRTGFLPGAAEKAKKC